MYQSCKIHKTNDTENIKKTKEELANRGAFIFSSHESREKSENKLGLNIIINKIDVNSRHNLFF